MIVLEGKYVTTNKIFRDQQSRQGKIVHALELLISYYLKIDPSLCTYKQFMVSGQFVDNNLTDMHGISNIIKFALLVYTLQNCLREESCTKF